MTVIETIDAQYFRFNGIPYFKNFLSQVYGNLISIYNCYDRRDVRLELESYTQVQVDGVVFPNVAALQTALLPVIYTRDTLGTGPDATKQPFSVREVYNGSGVIAATIPAGFEVQTAINLTDINAVVTYVVADGAINVTGGASEYDILFFAGRY
jgi:hypothetical protein